MNCFFKLSFFVYDYASPSVPLGGSPGARCMRFPVSKFAGQLVRTFYSQIGSGH
jgi:hypothetical protein